MQAFWLDRNSGIPVKLQIMAQVKYQIAAGHLYPGDQLPSLRDLAEGLSINLNTVVRALDQLMADGYLQSHQGRGVFVADAPPGERPGAALRSLLIGALAPAQEWGMTPEEFALALFAQAHQAKAPRPTSHRLLVIGTAHPDLRRIQYQLEATLPHLAVVPRLPEEVGRPGPVALTVTTLFHTPPQGGPSSVSAPPSKGAQPTTTPAKVLTLASPDEAAQLARLHSLPPGSLVILAAGDWVQAARIRLSLEASGLTQLCYTPVTGADGLIDKLATASALLAVRSGLAIAKEAQARRPDLPVLVEPTEVTAAALAAIRQSIAAPPPTPGIHLRSAWV